jgi:hypothetical protein
MATYDNLPVYKATYDMLVQIFRVCGNMQRDYKFTLGEKIKNETVSLIVHIYRANCVPDKKPLIDEARVNSEVIRLMLRLLFDLGQLNLENYAKLNETLESISKQLTAWSKYQKVTG